MNVCGVMKTNVQVDVDVYELFNGLASYFGLYDVFNPSRSSYWELKTAYNGMVGIVEYIDNSYHGSSMYETSGNVILNENSINAYKYLKEIKELIPKFKD